MKKFLAGCLIYATGLFALAGALGVDEAQATHHVWLFCHKADGDANYKHYVKDNPYISGLQGYVHTRYKCIADQGTGWWYWVLAPWPH